jgi:predicted alpha/beta hydrolase family esterase
MWYPWIAEKLFSELGIEVSLRGFPDHLYAHEEIWKEFALKDLHLDESTLLIGHSSGAACSMRLMEDHKVFGCVLVSAYDSDLGDEVERESGYFSRPFDYEAMRRHALNGIVQFHSASDHLVPVSVARRVAEGFQAQPQSPSLSTYQYCETGSDGHFQCDDYDEVMWPHVFEMCTKSK